MVSDLINSIQSSAQRLHSRISEIRQDLHRHPELSFEEARTAEQIKLFLAQQGISYSEGWAGHGVVASVKGDHEGPVVMLRADMDALPIQERNDVPYKSIHDGKMHACGHDVHTSCLLGVAAILAENQKDLHGEVRFIFQPGEEKLPGGASMMLREGLLESVQPDWMIAQHVFPSLQAGHVGFRSGAYMASADELFIAIKGKGGHAATPHLCIDPILIAARVVTALQEVVSRRIDPITPGVLTIGRIYSDGGATNIIPDTVYLEGTLRAMHEEWRFAMHQIIRNLVEQTCLASGALADMKIVVGYPSLQNDEKVTQMCRDAAVEFLGPDKVHDLPLRMSSEDFAFYSRQVPATFYRLGTGWIEEERNFPVHSNRFDINEQALETGMGLMAYVTMRYLAPPLNSSF